MFTKYLICRNLWTLDFVVCLLFDLLFGHFINMIDFDGTQDRKRIRLLTDVLGYVGGAGSAFVFHKRMSKLPSWVWAAVLGSLLRVLLMNVTSLYRYPSYREHFASWPNFYSAAGSLIEGMVMNWIMWAVGALACVFAARVVAFFAQRLFGRIELGN